MTRLTEEHIHHISSTWVEYENRLQNETGLSLFEVACSTFDLNLIEAKKKCHGQKIAVIPLTSGEGIIANFVENVKSICDHLGFESVIVSPDDTGFQEFRKGDFDLAIWANDDEYFVENKDASIRIDNNITTGKSFAEVLRLMIKKACKVNESIVEGTNTKFVVQKLLQTIVIRGCGPIGTNAAFHLGKRGYTLKLYDSNEEKACELQQKLLARNIASEVIEKNKLPQQLEKVGALFDAAPNPAQEDVFGTCSFEYISAPCVPCLWKKEQGMWHDPLQLGTAAMLLAAANNTAV